MINDLIKTRTVLGLETLLQFFKVATVMTERAKVSHKASDL